MAFFGVVEALTTAYDGVGLADAARWLAHFDDVQRAAERFSRSGIACRAAIGIHPRQIPWNDLDLLLERPPDRIASTGAVALGEIGLSQGGAREEDVLGRQLDLAGDLRRPCVLV